jgi:hypothetical protein
MSDKAYREWIQTLPSCIDGESYSEWMGDIGEWRNPACHVRRAGESGTAYKADFVCVPMTNAQHHEQTVKGELSCLLRYLSRKQLQEKFFSKPSGDWERIAKHWFDAQRDEYRRRWTEKTGQAPWKENEFINA